MRVKVKFTPEWGAVAGYAVNYIAANKWRCDWINDFDDLMQDAYLVFHKVSEHYPRVVEPKHFLALFKTALRNSIHDKSRVVRKNRQALDDGSIDPTEISNELVDFNEGTLRVRIALAPKRVQAALVVMEQQPKSIRRVFSGRRQSLNQRLRQMTGLRGTYDLVSEIKSALT